MLFQHTLDKVLSGEKTLTSRLVKPGEEANCWHVNGDDDLTIDEIIIPRAKPTLYGDTWRSVHVVGETYAVQPGRGKPAVARIRVLAIKRYDVREISAEDVLAEGFQSRLGFLETWTAIHDRAAAFYPEDGHYRYYAGRKEKWVSVNAPHLYAVLLARPDERYDAWQLRFELVK